MKILAISGSARHLSTNTALLVALQGIAPPSATIRLYDAIGALPVFSPDLERPNLPGSVRSFIAEVASCDGLLIASPEYVRGIPGGLKNAIDWLVSGDEIIGKPIALVHASHRGDDMLEALRKVLSTVSANFNEALFLRMPVMKLSPQEIADAVKEPANRAQAQAFLSAFADFCAGAGSGPQSTPL